MTPDPVTECQGDCKPHPNPFIDMFTPKENAMIPTPGRIVEYTLSEQDADAINRRIVDARRSLQKHRDDADGSVIHVGNDVKAGDTYPLIITRVWGSTEESAVNGQVMLDGNHTYWATSVTQGDGERQWRPFPRS